MDYTRYAIYYAPRPSPFQVAAAAWLGWNAEGPEVPLPDDMPPFAPSVTEAARKYGFHGTLKAPFRLAPGQDEAKLRDAVATLATGLPAVTLPAMVLRRIGGFLALTPQSASPALSIVAATIVRDLDPFRAPLTDAEIARRRPEKLTERQFVNLRRWGYPYILDDFQFHLTLAGDLDPALSAKVAQALEGWLLPLVPRPFPVQDLCLFGEGMDGRFRLISRHALTG